MNPHAGLTDEQIIALNNANKEDFDGESISHHEAPQVLEPLPNGIPHGILAQLNKLKAYQNDAKNRKIASDKREAKARKAAKAAKVARKKNR